MSGSTSRERVSTGRIVAAVICGIAVAAALRAIGGTPLASATGAVLVAAAVVLVAGFQDTAPPVHPEKPIPERAGLRSDVVRTAWSLRTVHGTITGAGLTHLRAFAKRRLERVGVDLFDPDQLPRVRELIGDDVADLLAGTRGLPTISQVEHCLDMLERISPDPKGTP